MLQGGAEKEKVLGVGANWRSMGNEEKPQGYYNVIIREMIRLKKIVKGQYLEKRHPLVKEHRV